MKAPSYPLQYQFTSNAKVIDVLYVDAVGAEVEKQTHRSLIVAELNKNELPESFVGQLWSLSLKV